MELTWDREFFDKGEYERIDKGANPQGSMHIGFSLIIAKENWVEDICKELEDICFDLENPLEQKKLMEDLLGDFYEQKRAEQNLG
jgi:hypothetical protein